MKALVFRKVNAPLSFDNIPDPVPEEGEVLVELKAAALNHRDAWIRKGQYPGLREGAVPGSDGAGELNGKAVLINPNINWGNDEGVQNKAYSILGMPSDGTFAEKVVVNADRIHDKPLHLSWEQAAALPLAGLTAYRAVFSRGRLVEGERVLINGVGGGVALFACQFAVAIGAEVFVTSSKPEKIAQAESLGAAGGALYTEKDWGKAFGKKVGGFDLIIDSAGGDGFNDLINAVKPAGRISFYGGTRGKITVSPQKIFWKQLDILGSTMGSDQDFVAMLQLVSDHKIVPHVDSVFSLEEGNAALDKMDRGEQFGKIVLKI